MPGPPKSTKKPGPPKAAMPSPKKEKRAAKTFSIKPWTGEGEGEKTVLYGPSGIGKSSLALLAETPLFVGVDDGARKLRLPNGDPVDAVQGIESYQDFRDALHSASLWDNHQTLVLDTLTRADSEWIQPHVIQTVKTDKGASVKSIEGYGWGKGWFHVLDAMRLLLMDIEGLARAGKDVILVCQEAAVKIANAEGADYIQDGPRLPHNGQCSCRQEVCEWADHVLRVGFMDTKIKAGVDDKVGKIGSRDTKRVVYVDAARHFFAKSRTLNVEGGMVAFDDPTDDSLWVFMKEAG